MPSQSKYAFGRMDGAQGYELPLPSGNVAMIRSMGPQQLISAGLLSDMDQLTEMVGSLHVGRMEGRPVPLELDDDRETMKEIVRNPERFTLLIRTVDKVLVAAAIEPRVVMAPNEGQPRKDLPEGTMYSDEVDFLDRVAVFQSATGKILHGLSDVKPFRAGPVADVESLADGQRAVDPTQPAA